MPKRDPGSLGEKMACEYMADYLKNDCGCERADVESFKESMASEVSIIKENQENIQNTLNEVLYHSIPFWRFKARKAVKQLKKQ